MDNRASSRFALVRGCEDSSGLLEFGFGHCISLLFAAFVLMFLIPSSASAQATATLNGSCAGFQQCGDSAGNHNTPQY